MNHYEWLKTQPEWESSERTARLELLFPPFRRIVERMMKEIAAEGLHFKVFETFRSEARQLSLYHMGYSKLKTPGPHNFGLAVDFAVWENGRWSWESKDWNWLGALGEKYGLIWGGRWKSIKDCPHFQCIPVDLKLYARIRKGEFYPDGEETTITWPDALEPPQITLFRSLYDDFIRYIPLEERTRYLRTLNMIRPYLREEYKAEPK